MEKLLTTERRSTNYRQRWSLFDQMISQNLPDIKEGTYNFAHANIFDKHFLKEYKGRFAGLPFRTFAGRK